MPASIPIIAAVKFVVDDELVIADPCYVDQNDVEGGFSSLTPGHGGLVIPDAAGSWTGRVIRCDEGPWGTRVATLRLERAGAPTVRYLERLLGAVDVDSGQMYAGCRSNLPLDYDALLAEYIGDVDRHILAFGGGVISSTGFGDGCYRVVASEDASVIEVRFIEDEEECFIEDEEE